MLNIPHGGITKNDKGKITIVKNIEEDTAWMRSDVQHVNAV